MAHEKVFVVCENKCFEEGLTKKQIEEKIYDSSQDAAGGTIDPATGIKYKYRYLTQAEYNALVTKDPNTVYFVTDQDDFIADVALYASADKSKGTIEERLINLGFKEGVASIDGATATTNTLKKQGKYCIFNLVLEGYAIQAQETKTITLTIPVEFRPKEETKINFTYYNNVSSVGTLEKFSEITVGTDGIIVISITGGIYGNGIMFPKILNAGWELP